MTTSTVTPVVAANTSLNFAPGTRVSLNIAPPTEAGNNALTVTITSLPTGGTIFLPNGQAVTLGEVLTAYQIATLIYQAPAKGSGSMGGFSYQVADGKGGIASQTVSLAVTAPPTVEAAKTVNALLNSTAALNIAQPTDAAGYAMTITVTSLPANGAVQLANGQAVTAGQVLTAAQLTGLTFQMPAGGGTIGAPTTLGNFAYSVGDSFGNSTHQTVSLFGDPITTGTPSNPSSPITVARQSFIARPDALISLGEMFQVSASGANAPATIVVTGLDNNHYAGAETYDYGTLTAKSGVAVPEGGTLTFTLVNGQYVTTNSASFSSTNGLTLSDFTFQASDQINRVQNFSISAFDQAGKVMQTQNVAIVTSPNAVDATPGVAGAAEIVQVAKSFIGQTWDSQGCWNLAQDISAEAGASLSLASFGGGAAAAAGNGQWTVAYNATGGVNANWMATLQAGDMIEYMPANSNNGHIATVSQVSGGQVFIIDNSGPAPGTAGADPSDVLIAQSQLTAASVTANTVVVYRLTGAAPAVGDLPPTVDVGYNSNLQIGQTVAASTLFQASDPDSQPILDYKVLDAGGGSGHFALNGVTQTNGQWIDVAPGSLGGLTYTGGGGASSDTIEVMAFDGQVWSNVATGRAVTLPSSVSNGIGGTPTNLGALAGGTVLAATDVLSRNETNHYYSFTLAQAATVTLTLTDLAANCDLYLYGPSGFSTGSTKGGTQDQSITASLAAGTYTVGANYQTGATQSNATDFNLAIGLGTSVTTPAPQLVPPPASIQHLVAPS